VGVYPYVVRRRTLFSPTRDVVFHAVNTFKHSRFDSPFRHWFKMERKLGLMHFSGGGLACLRKRTLLKRRYLIHVSILSLST